MSNILITSASNKVTLIECIKSTCNSLNKIIVADANPNNISRYFSSDYWEMPLLPELNVQDLIDYCNKNEVSYIIPTRDAELLYFSQHKSFLKDQGIQVLVSTYDAVNVTNDKLLFYYTLQRLGIQAIPTSTSINIEAARYVIKERTGAGSKKIYVNIDIDTLKEVFGTFKAPIIQPYIKGREYSIDVYVTQNKKVKAVVVRERTLVIDGESQITKVVKHEKLEQLISKAALALNLEGHVMFQAIEDGEGALWIVECNARIGGASTLSIYAGLDTFNWWVAECEGKNIDDWPVEIKELKQIRYKKDLIL